MTEMEKLCEQYKIEVEIKDGAPFNESFPDSNGYRATLKFGKRRLTVPFYTGKGWTRKPNAADVLNCIVWDTVSVDNARSFEDWCDELGYDTDSRKAEKIYGKCVVIGIKVHKFLGADFDKFVGVEH